MLNCFVRKYTKLGTLVRKSKAYVQCFKILDGTSCELVVNLKKKKKLLIYIIHRSIRPNPSPFNIKTEKISKAVFFFFLFTFLFFPPHMLVASS